MSNEILRNDNSVSLDWNDVASATAYHIQVSKDYLDFRATLLVDDSTLVSSAKTFTATGNGIYFWRWKPNVGGWQPWREWNSFIINTSGSTDVSATSWMFINKDNFADTYILNPQPITKPIENAQHIWEASRRNRAGKLKTQLFITKSTISMDLNGTRAMGNDQKAEIIRFFNSHVPFYLATRYDNQTTTDYVYRCYEVKFTEQPQLDVAGGNICNFEEV